MVSKLILTFLVDPIRGSSTVSISDRPGTVFSWKQNRKSSFGRNGIGILRYLKSAIGIVITDIRNKRKYDFVISALRIGNYLFLGYYFMKRS